MGPIDFCNLIAHLAHNFVIKEREIVVMPKIKCVVRSFDYAIFCTFKSILHEIFKGRGNVAFRNLIPEINDSGTICFTELLQNKSVFYFNPK